MHMVMSASGELVPVPADPPVIPTREQIERLEAEMVKHEQVEIPTRHYFADGLYAREITIPAGCLLTGEVHKREHMNFLVKGEITVWTEDGMKRLKAPQLLISRPGTKRAGLAHSETIWTTVHALPDAMNHDIAAIEQELVEVSRLRLFNTKNLEN